MTLAMRDDTPTLIRSADRSPPGTRCKNRAIEWLMLYAMAGIVLVLLFSPKAIEASRFFLLTEFGITQTAILVYTAAIACVRAMALYWNGLLPGGYLVRAICSVAAAVIWGNMALALAVTSTAEAFSMSVPVFAVLCGGELFSFYRALIDQGTAASADPGYC